MNSRARELLDFLLPVATALPKVWHIQEGDGHIRIDVSANGITMVRASMSVEESVPTLLGTLVIALSAMVRMEDKAKEALPESLRNIL